jgi:hypothetical protein
MEQKRGDDLRAQYEENERELDLQDETLYKSVGELGDLHDIVTQLANDIDLVIDNSLVTAQMPERDEFLDRFSASKALPAIDELEGFWHLVLDEMAESGKIVAFHARVITSSGAEVEQNVIRVGCLTSSPMAAFFDSIPIPGNWWNLRDNLQATTNPWRVNWKSPVVASSPSR